MKMTEPEVEIEEEVIVPPKQEEIVPKIDPTVKPKRVADLNDKEKEDILHIYRNGGSHPNYNVQLYKNGNSRITLRRKVEPVSSQLLKEDLPRTDKKVHLSDNQLLMEHVMDLQIKCEKLMNKHKKMKKRLNEYEQYEDIEEEPIKPIQKVEIEEPEESPPPKKPAPKNVYEKPSKSWRSHVSYV
jgi:hypothetical protein